LARRSRGDAPPSEFVQDLQTSDGIPASHDHQRRSAAPTSSAACQLRVHVIDQSPNWPAARREGGNLRRESRTSSAGVAAEKSCGDPITTTSLAPLMESVVLVP
jgi:hypothetical protein